MERVVNAVVVIGALSICVALISFGVPSDASAGPTASEVYSTSVTCLPPNLLPADAGHLMVPVTCSAGFVAVAAETESSVPGYFCGKGPTLADYETKCRKRCVGCYNGSAISDDVQMVLSSNYNLRCVSGGSDAGVVFNVTCAR